MRPALRSWLCSATIGTALLLACGVNDSSAAELWRLAGPAVAARLVAADAAGATFAWQGTEAAVPWAELVRWGSPAELADPTSADPTNPAVSGRDPEWLLRPAGVIYAHLESSEEDRFGLSSASFFSIDLRRDDLRGVIFAAGLSPAQRAALQAWADEARDRDRLRLQNGDELSGQLEHLGEQDLSFQGERGTFETPLERVTAVALAATGAPPASGKLWVGLADGSRLLVSALKIEDEQAELELPSGERWQTQRALIVFLQPRQSRADFLSDLEPESYRQLPFLGAPWPHYGRNQNVAGGPLRSREQLHLSGLGVHGAAQLTYRLEKPYRRFAALAAIDRAAGSKGSAVFRVFVDPGDGKWVERFASDVVRGGQPPIPIDVDIAGAKRLRLVVDYADRGDELDYADWLEARAVP